MDALPLRTLPRSGPARERLRETGQFWTPDWVADAMVGWAAADADHVFDPAVGAGAVFRAAKRRAARRGSGIALLGSELDPAALRSGLDHGLTSPDLQGVTLGDFMKVDSSRRFRAIVANPPYVRHHRFTAESKARLHAFAQRTVGEALDRRAGLHVFFLLRALTLLEPGGRLAFLVPADICEGRFAPALWGWIAQAFRIEAAITFAPEASPFPGVDTNPILLLITRAPPHGTLRWVRVLRPGTPELAAWCLGGAGP